MKHSLKQRAWAILLTLAMIISMLPVMSISVDATAVGTTGVDYTTKSTGRGTFKASLSGNTIEVTAKGINLGIMASTGAGTVTLKNNTSNAATLVFTCTVTQGSGTVAVPGEANIGASGSTKTYTKALPAGESVVITITGPEGGTMKVDVTIVSLTAAQSDIPTTFQAPTNGSYTVDNNAITANTTPRKSSTESYAVKATPASGYKFFGWYSTKENGYISHAASTSLTIREETTVYPVFVPTDTPVFGVGAATATNVPYDIITNAFYLYSYSYYKVSPDKQFTDLQEALNYAKSSGQGYVVLMNSCTLPAKSDGTAYTIPSGVTLLIPFESTNKGYHDTPYIAQVPSGKNGSNHRPTVYRTLTLADGVKIEVAGKLEVGAEHYISHGGITLGGQPISTYAQIIMGANSSITINNGGNLYAWGYITGADSASVTAKNGATVYEKLQVSDYGGGSVTDKLTGEGIFPFNQYYLQNVEVYEKFEYGSALICHAGVYGSGVVGYTMPMFGKDSSYMFQLGSGSWASKYYNNATDRLTIEAYGTFTMNPISLAGKNTGEFVLPFNHNFDIILKSGTTATTKQDIMMQPGSTLTIEEGATFNVGTRDANMKFFLMGAADWGNYCYGRFLQQVPFVPRTGTYPNIRQKGEEKTPNESAMVDAKIIVNGTLNVYGALYTSDSNANVVTTNEKGVINLKTKSPTDFAFKESNIVNVDVAYDIISINMNAAVLNNDSKTQPTTDTAGAAAESTYKYCADCDVWYKESTYTVTWGNIMSEEYAAHTEPNFKVSTDKAPDAQNTYTFEGWAATEKGSVLANLPHVTKDVTYYPIYSTIKNKYSVTWKDSTGKTLYSEDLEYGTVPSYNGATPTKNSDLTYHYTFAGWATTEGGTVLSELPFVTGNVTYYAIFTAEAHDKNKIEGGKHYCTECNYQMGSCGDTNGDHKCDVGGEAYVCHQGTLTLQNGKVATCKENGWNDYYKCSCGKYYADERAQTLINDLEVWKEYDGKVVYEGQCSWGEWTTVVNATCTDEGSKTRKCSVCGAERTEAIPIDKNNHNWGELTYTWSEDGKTCTAKRVCGNDANHVESETVNATGEVTTPANCTVKGTTTYTANFEAAWAETQTKEVQNVAFDASNHASNEITYIDNTGDTHTVKHTCCGATEAPVPHDFTNGDCACGAEEPVADDEIIYGDADGDGEITMLDSIILEQYLNDYDVTLDEAAADVDGDGEITMLDSIVLQQYLNDYDVTLGPA